MQFHGFDWDEGNLAKCRKHGLTIDEIEALFEGPFDVFPDATHSGAETRLRAIGRGSSGRWVFCAFTIRRVAGLNLVRPISARYMHDREVAYYEKEITRSANR
jgi:uncharacterized DUF497 family protein